MQPVHPYLAGRDGKSLFLVETARRCNIILRRQQCSYHREHEAVPRVRAKQAKSSLGSSTKVAALHIQTCVSAQQLSLLPRGCRSHLAPKGETAELGRDDASGRMTAVFQPELGWLCLTPATESLRTMNQLCIFLGACVAFPSSSE